MKTLKKFLGGAVLAAWCIHATAGLHQICYEGLPEQRNGKTYSKVVVGCANELGGTCEVVIPPSPGGRLHSEATPWRSASFVASRGSFFYYEYDGPDFTFDFGVAFKDAGGGTIATRNCSVALRAGAAGHAFGWVPADGAVLTGFSTDVSGLITTGVWRSHYKGASARVSVPGQFIAVGGGASTSGDGFIAQSRRSNRDARAWLVDSFTDAQQAPADTMAYAIGLRIAGVPPVDVTDDKGNVTVGLDTLMATISANSAGVASGMPEAIPTARAAMPLTSFDVALGGDFRAWADRANSRLQLGQFGSVTAPRLGTQVLKCVLVGTVCPAPTAVAWRVESKDDLGNHPGYVSTTLRHLPPTLTVGGTTFEVRGKVVRSTSAAGLSPAVDANGLRGQYALTGIGGEVHWRPNANPATASNRLSRLEPRADLGGASASSKHGTMVTSASITAYALGIKLVPVGTPEDVDERPFIFAKETVYLPWLCQVFTGLDKWPGCAIEEVMPMGSLCQAFPDLNDLGLCGGKP
jgi:hypothetical protein